MNTKNYIEFKDQYLAPVKSKIVWNINSIFWYIKEYKNFSTQLLKENNIHLVKIFSMKNWHLGWRYFVGVDQNGREYFIKYGEQKQQIRQEIVAMLKMQKIKSAYSPALIGYGFTELYGYVIQEKINGITFDQMTCHLVEFKQQESNIIEQFIEIAEDLKKAGIIHRDIRPENLIYINESKRVFLIDYAASVIKGKKGYFAALYQEKYLKGLGSIYKPEIFLWDDAYSLSEIIRFIDKQVEANPLWTKLNSRIGKFTYAYKRIQEENGFK